MTTNPKVSICIPSYKQTNFLAQTLHSIKDQKFHDYEIIVTDDSPDSSVEDLVKQYKRKVKINYFHNATPLGSPANWNRAIKKSSGKYIKIMHHDDWFSDSSSLGEFVRLLDENPDAGLAFSGATAKVAESNKAWHHFASRNELKQLQKEPTYLFMQNIIGPPSSTIIRRKFFEEYDETLIWLVDIAQYIKILLKTKFVATTSPLIFSTTQAPHQITDSCIKNKNLNIFEHFYIYDSIKSFIPEKSLSNYLNKLNELIFNYNISSLKEIESSGFTGEIPKIVKEAINAKEPLRSCRKFKTFLSKNLRSCLKKFRNCNKKENEFRIFKS
jgi:glycosyltransferase involved in cell wall biosynthesis